MQWAGDSQRQQRHEQNTQRRPHAGIQQVSFLKGAVGGKMTLQAKVNTGNLYGGVLRWLFLEKVIC